MFLYVIKIKHQIFQTYRKNKKKDIINTSYQWLLTKVSFPLRTKFWQQKLGCQNMDCGWWVRRFVTGI